jgi:catechol 2,3-dioxygenase-like lactoylglutathione lyase family enzyme
LLISRVPLNEPDFTREGLVSERQRAHGFRHVQRARLRDERNADPVRHESDNPLQFVEFDHVMHRDANLPEKAVDEATSKRTPLVANERLRFEQRAPRPIRQLARVAHLAPEEIGHRKTSAVDGDAVPVRHFGVVLPMNEWQSTADKLTAAGVKFIIEPHVRFKGEVGEQATMFFLDPSGNALEIKAFANIASLFAK